MAGLPLHDAGRTWLADDPTAPIALTGDWNIAPTDDDVWDADNFADKTHTSDPERAAFQAVVDAGYADVVRPFTPGEFTYGTTPQLRFARREGMRIDFALCSPALAARVTHAAIDRRSARERAPATTARHRRRRLTPTNSGAPARTTSSPGDR